MNLTGNYMQDATLRHALNDLTRKTFCFDFESWVTGGYFEGDYIPYSYVEDGKVLSNVSVNRMQFMQNGKERNYIQLGTVMTDENYRKQGLARKLMEHVVKQYKDKCDGFYLFANLEALDFYRKLGFKEETEYRYSLKKEFCRQEVAGEVFTKVGEADQAMKQKYLNAVRHSAANAALEQVNKFGLQLFYTADLENVYYAEDLDCFIVMEMEADTLLMQSIICKEKVALREVLRRIDQPFEKCILGFAPCQEDAGLCDAQSYDGEDDYRLFYLGQKVESIEQEKLYFPELSHA